MNQLYNQVSGHTVGYIGFITNYMANYLNAVCVSKFEGESAGYVSKSKVLKSWPNKCFWCNHDQEHVWHSMP